MNRPHTLHGATRRLVLPTIAALALGAALTGCGAANESSGSSSSSGSGLSGQLSGAGSSAQEAAMDAWRSKFQSANSGVTVNYNPAGSGAGVESFNSGGVDFAGSDSPLSTSGEVAAAKKRCGADAIEVPDYISPIALVYNLDGVDSLQLSPKTAADIFSGKVKTWNDAEIKADNPDAKLPSTRIAPVHRSDESGTTDNFTDYLQKASKGAWKFEHGKTWPIKSGEGAKGTSGVVAAVGNASGSIGYADDSQAGSLSKASIKVGSDYVAPSAEGAAKTLDASPLEDGRPASDIAVNIDRATTESGAYPLLLTSYLIACPTYKDSGTADKVKGFLSYIVSSDGQTAAGKSAGSAPLPTKLASKVQGIIDGISAG